MAFAYTTIPWYILKSAAFRPTLLFGQRQSRLPGHQLHATKILKLHHEVLADI